MPRPNLSQPCFSQNFFLCDNYSASSVKSPFEWFLVNNNVFIYNMVSTNPTVLKLGKDLCVSFLDMPVKSEEPESLSAIVTGAYATGGNFWSKCISF